MPTNAKILKKELRKLFETQIVGGARKFTQHVGETIIEGVVTKTAVAFGEARGGWIVGLHRRPANPGTLPNDTNGARTISRGKAVLRGMRGIQAIHVTNFTVQADILENGRFSPPDPGPSKRGHPPGQRVGQILVSGGYSTQSPQGMVAVTLEEVRTQFGP